MHIVLLSNYLNHHMLPICLSLYANRDIEFHFVATEEITSGRKTLGYKEYNTDYDFVICSYKNLKEKERAIQICNSCDVLIYGSAPEAFVKKRVRENRLTFRYSERPLKKGLEIWKYPVRFIRWHRWYPNSKQMYLLCSSAYTAADFARFGLFKQKAYKWGYFPEVKKYEDADALITEKRPNSLLWVARFLEWKHPEIAVEIAKRLKTAGYQFQLNLIGNGELEKRIREKIMAEGLEDCVHLLGAMQPEQVREYMEQSEIFLFTSDRNEGWGAVLNESMNSASAVVASHAIGAVPFLIENGKNGLIYKDGDLDDLYQKVKWLLDHPKERKEIAENAYSTMTEQWNAKNAARRLIVLSEAIMNGEKSLGLFQNGVCSRADILKDDWI